MNKRQRKKAHVGEFREDGFAIRAEAPTLEKDPDKADKFVDELIEFVESKDGQIGGGVGNKVDVFYTRHKKTCTEADREIMETYLSNHPLVTRFKVGPLVDSWHAPDDWYELEF